jgi:hypothetical protein
MWCSDPVWLGNSTILKNKFILSFLNGFIDAASQESQEMALALGFD